MSTKYSIHGVVSNITKNGGITKKQENWEAIEFTVTEGGEHPNSVRLKVYKQGDYIKHLPKLSNGDVVDAEFVTSVREYKNQQTGKVSYHMECNAWTVKVVSGQPQVAASAAEDDDLPF